MFRRDPFADPERTIRRVYAYVAYRIGDGPDAQDVTSATFERALRYRATYDAARGEPIAWLLGIARRLIADSFASRETPAEPTELEAPDDIEASVLRRLELAGAVATLGQRDRELIALRYGADLSARRIAHMLGVSTNAVEVALSRALGRLRAELGREERKDPAPQPVLRVEKA